MTDEPVGAAVPLAQRQALVANLLPFAVLPPEAQGTLAAQLQEERYAAGSIVAAEGEVGDRLYLIARGRAAVTTQGTDGPVILTTLETGALFGEVALLTGGRRTATVTALTPLLLLTLDAPAFDALLAASPLARRIVAAFADTLVLTSFLKQASPFAPLEAVHLRRLAAHLKSHAVGAGSVIVRQGQPGYACFLLRAGHVEVVQQEGGVERHLTTLGPGALFGEVALLSAGPRTATVRALEPCALLVLHRPDLLRVIGVDPRVEAQLSGTMGRGDRPGQGAAVLGSALLARAMGWYCRRKERA